MKLLFAAAFAVLAVSAFAEDKREIDWSKVVPITEMPGFWDGREIKPVSSFKNQLRTGRIVGGTAIPNHSHPHQAALVAHIGANQDVFCGGSLITFRSVLTAAHCLDVPESITVILGAHFLFSHELDQQWITVLPDGYRKHASYNPSNFNNDIAILILPRAAIFDKQTQPIRLPTNEQYQNTFAGELGTVSGWGRTSDNSPANSRVTKHNYHQ